MKQCIAFTTVTATVLIFVTMTKLNIRWTMTQSMTARVWQWSAERQSCEENNQIIAEFYQPRRFIKDWTLT
jgi:hypothetical protein